VILAFSTRELRDRCEIQLDGERAYGVLVAEQIRERLVDLLDAETVLDLPTGSPREVIERQESRYELDLPEGFRIELRPNHHQKPLPTFAGTDCIDWTKVTRVTVAIFDPRETGHDN
jgi:hypothetical protein